MAKFEEKFGDWDEPTDQLTNLLTEQKTHELSPEEIATGINNCRWYFYELYGKGGDFENEILKMPSMRDNTEAIFQLFHLTDRDIKNLHNGKITSRLGDFAFIFLKELADFMEKFSLGKNQMEKERFQDFLEGIHGKFFNFSPNIVNYLRLEQQIELASKPSCKNIMSSELIGEIAYGVTFAPENIKEAIASNILSKTDIEQVVIIKTLGEIAQECVNNDSWADSGLKKIIDILKTLKEKNTSLLVELATRAALEEVTSLKDWYSGNLRENYHSHLLLEQRKKLDQKNAELKNTYRSFETGDETETYYRLSSDVICSGQNYQSLSKYAYVLDEVDQALKKDPIHSADGLERILQAMDSGRISRIPNAGVLEAINSALFSGNSTEKDREEFWKKIFPRQKPGQILDHLRKEREYAEFNEKKKSELSRDSYNYQRNLMKLFINAARELIKSVDQTVSARLDDELIKNIMSTEGDLEEAVNSVIEVLKVLHIISNTRNFLSLDASKNQNKYSSLLNNYFNAISASESFDFSIKSSEPSGIFEHLKQEFLSEKSKKIEEQQKEAEEKFSETLSYRRKVFLKDWPSTIDRIKKNLSEIKKVLDKEKLPLHFRSMLEMSEDKSFPTYFEIDDQSVVLLKVLHSASMKMLLETELGFKLEEIRLGTQLQLVDFLQSEDQKTFKRIKSVIRNKPHLKQEILNTFLVTRTDKNMGMKILDLAEREDSDNLFKVMADIIQLINESVGLVHTSDKNTYEKSVMKKISEMIEAANSDGATNLRLLTEATNYQKDVIAWGSLFNAVTSHKSAEQISPEKIRQKFRKIKVSVLECGGVIRDADSMELESNYNQPENFGVRDYMMLKKNFEKQYKDIDPGALKYVLESLPKDLNNESVKFIMVRNNKNDLIGTIKYKKIQDNPEVYYIGTMYVNEEFQKGFGVGNYLQKMVEELVGKNKEIVGDVVLANPSMERHIEMAGAVGISMLKLETSGDSTKDLLRISWNNGKNYLSKDKEKFDRKKIIKLAEERMISDSTKLEEADVLAYKFDTSGKDESFQLKSKDLLAKGYEITRWFYGKKDGKADLANTYVVFEKPKQFKL